MDAGASVLVALALYAEGERLYALELNGLATGTFAVERQHGKGVVVAAGRC